MSHAEPMRRVIQQYPALVVLFEQAQDEIPHARAHASGTPHMLSDLDNYLGLLILEPLMTALENTVKKF